MPRTTNVRKREIILGKLREAEGETVADAALSSAAGCTLDTVKNHVHHLRGMGFEIRRERGEGFVLCDRRDGATIDDDVVSDGRDWRPEPLRADSEDPLLDALRREHPERLGGKHSHFMEGRL